MKNIGIIGGGQIFETVHYVAIKATQNIGDIHVVELNPIRREELDQKYPELKTHGSIEELLATSKITDAIVCVPNKFHASTTISLLQAGINVLCEKPPAISSKEAYEMWKTAEKNNVKLYYNFHLRQLDSLAQFKTQVSDVYSIDIKALRRRGIPGWGSFINQEMQGGGALIDLGIHYLDLVLSLVDQYDFDSIHAITDDFIGKNETEGDFGSWDNTKFTVENFCSASLKGNFMLTLNTSFAHNIEQKDIYEVSLYTHSGRVELLDQEQYNTSNELIYTANKPIDQQELRIESSKQFLSEEYNNMCDGKHGYLIQDIVEKIYESAGR